MDSHKLSTNMVKQLTPGGQCLQIQHFRENQLTPLPRMLAETAGNALFHPSPVHSNLAKHGSENQGGALIFSKSDPDHPRKLARPSACACRKNRPAEEATLEIGHKCLQFANTGCCVLAWTGPFRDTKIPDPETCRFMANLSNLVSSKWWSRRDSNPRPVA